MNLKQIIEELEENLKPNIWDYCESEETSLQKQVKETTNLLLDLLESLEMEGKWNTIQRKTEYIK